MTQISYQVAEEYVEVRRFGRKVLKKVHFVYGSNTDGTRGREMARAYNNRGVAKIIDEELRILSIGALYGPEAAYSARLRRRRN